MAQSQYPAIPPMLVTGQPGQPENTALSVGPPQNMEGFFYGPLGPTLPSGLPSYTMSPNMVAVQATVPTYGGGEGWLDLERLLADWHAAGLELFGEQNRARQAIAAIQGAVQRLQGQMSTAFTEVTAFANDVNGTFDQIKTQLCHMIDVHDESSRMVEQAISKHDAYFVQAKAEF